MAKKNRVPLTTEIVQELFQHKDRTGLGPVALLYGRRKELPIGLTSSTINNWMHGQVQTAREDHLNAVLNLWRSLPDYSQPLPKIRSPKLGEPGSGYLKITEDIRSQLVKYRDKRYIPAAIFHYFEDLPKGLTTSTISSWITSKTKFANKAFLYCVLDHCKEMDTLPHRPATITPRVLQELKQHKTKSGLGPIGILKLARQDEIPDGYSYVHHKNWLSGNAQTTREDYINFVLKLYRKHNRGND